MLENQMVFDQLIKDEFRARHQDEKELLNARNTDGLMSKLFIENFSRFTHPGQKIRYSTFYIHFLGKSIIKNQFHSALFSNQKMHFEEPAVNIEAWNILKSSLSESLHQANDALLLKFINIAHLSKVND